MTGHLVDIHRFYGIPHPSQSEKHTKPRRKPPREGPRPPGMRRGTIELWGRRTPKKRDLPYQAERR